MMTKDSLILFIQDQINGAESSARAHRDGTKGAVQDENLSRFWDGYASGMKVVLSNVRDMT